MDTNNYATYIVIAVHFKFVYVFVYVPLNGVKLIMCAFTRGVARYAYSYIYSYTDNHGKGLVMILVLCIYG